MKKSQKESKAKPKEPKVEEDPDKEFWEKQGDLDRFVNETRTRKMIQEVCLPMLENQTSLQAKLTQEVDK